MHELPREVQGGGKAEQHVSIAAPVDHVWRTFLEVDRWSEYSGVYEFVRWNTGSPWRVGSTFHARMQWPISLTVTHVIMTVDPEREVRWLVHAIGMVVERCIHFIPVGDSTEISSTAIFFGTQTQQLPGEVGELMQQFTRRFYNDLKAACESSWQEQINA